MTICIYLRGRARPFTLRLTPRRTDSIRAKIQADKLRARIRRVTAAALAQ